MVCTAPGLQPLWSGSWPQAAPRSSPPRCVLWPPRADGRLARPLEPGVCCQGPPLTFTTTAYSSARSGLLCAPAACGWNPGRPGDAAGPPPQPGVGSWRKRDMSFPSASDTGEVPRQADSRADGPSLFGCGHLCSQPPVPPFLSKELQWHRCQRSRDIAFFCLTLMILVPSELPWALEKPLPLWASVSRLWGKQLCTQHSSVRSTALRRPRLGLCPRVCVGLCSSPVGLCCCWHCQASPLGIVGPPEISGWDWQHCPLANAGGTDPGVVAASRDDAAWPPERASSRLRPGAHPPFPFPSLPSPLLPLSTSVSSSLLPPSNPFSLPLLLSHSFPPLTPAPLV